MGISGGYGIAASLLIIVIRLSELVVAHVLLLVLCVCTGACTCQGSSTTPSWWGGAC